VLSFFFDSFFFLLFRALKDVELHQNTLTNKMNYPVVEINSPDNGYSTEQSSSEPSPPITNTV
jgi:hypothetical protein